MKKDLSITISLCRRALTLIVMIFVMFITLPQKYGWSTPPLEEEEEPPKRFYKDAKKGKRPPVARKEAPVIMGQPISHSGPQWGMSEEEIEYLFKNSKDYVCIVQFGGHFKRLNQT